MIIAIDGPVGTGKSTIARQVAKKLGFIHFDTGAMYRSFTYGVMKHHIEANQIKNYLDIFDFDIRLIEGQKHYYLEGEDITDKIRQPEVTAHVSEIAAIPVVREKLVKTQQTWAKGTNAVFEGRDIGTVVFPEAELKIFLTASTKVRAERRLKEWQEKFPEDSKNYSIEKMEKEIALRDKRDSTREVSPLRQAEDAYVIDTSDMSIDEVVNAVIALVDLKNSPLQ